MKQTFILVTLILSLSSFAKADIWKCQREGEQAASYTDTPTGEPGVNCEKVETIRFTKSGEQANKNAGAAPKSYSAPAPHITTQVKAKVKSASKPPAPKEEKKHASEGGKGGNHPSGNK